MKQVRQRNLVIAWEEARRFAQQAKERASKMLGYEGSGGEDDHSSYKDDEVDLGSVKSGAMVLGDGNDKMASRVCFLLGQVLEGGRC